MQYVLIGFMVVDISARLSICQEGISQMVKITPERRGINQREISKILGITEVYVSEILNGKKTAQGRLFEFAERLGVDLLPNKTILLFTFESSWENHIVFLLRNNTFRPLHEKGHCPGVLL